MHLMPCAQPGRKADNSVDMSEKRTKDMDNGRPFEERVFARFDSIDRRLSALEDQAQRYVVDTKPIWERALAEIMEIRTDLTGVKADLNEVKADLNEVKADVSNVRAELAEMRELSK